MKIFETVSFHLVKPCNMACKFCYATYNSFNVGKQLSLKDATAILAKLKVAGVEKVTFAGGEPMLYKHLPQLIKNAKMLGLTTSIITNGSLLTYDFLQEIEQHLDWLGLSIDSLDPLTNQKIGRISKRGEMDYKALIDGIHSNFDFKIKINTVVNRFNENESMKDFIEWTGTTRWKVFDSLKVEGQNETQFNAIKPSEHGFKRFVEHNAHRNMVIENNAAMTASYLLIDPLGRFYENWGEETRKSDSLVTSTVEKCLTQISLNRDAFINRGGIYEW